MEVLTVPPPVREKLGSAGSDGLVTMLAEVIRLGDERLDRRMAEFTARFEHRLQEETVELRLEMSNMKFELVTWMFLFWVGQLAISISVLSWMLRGIR